MSERTSKATKRGYSAEFVDSAAFDRKTCQHDWLVESTLIAGQPGVIGGESKALKTSIAIDLAISLGSGTRFLNTFSVPQGKRVAFLSGESGEATLQESARRICTSKKVKLRNCMVHWSTQLPDLSRVADRNVLRRFLREAKIDVVILDPLYLLMGGAGASASNLYEVGAVLHRAGRACLDAGATPVLVHHMTKSATKLKERESVRSLNLGDLAFAGIGEYARQWLLLGRREPYREGTGEHRLIMSVGGSAGHSGRWDVDVHEGVLLKDLRGRGWDVKVSPLDARSATPSADTKRDLAVGARGCRAI